jgi:FkbM family methyltransferase
MVSLLKKLLLGNKRLQSFWWKLYRLSLKGMNYDRGHVPTANGEVFALKSVLKRLGHEKSIVLFDVGANRGQYLKMAKSINENRLSIFCFEPQASAFSYLKTVADEYGNVKTENIGLGEKKGVFSLYRDTEASEFASMYPATYVQYNVNLSIKENIHIETLDEYCLAKNIKRVHFLKLDVEGHEIPVLKGAFNMINSGNIDFIQFEYGLASMSSRTLLKDFFELLKNYRIYRILPSGLELLNYSEYHELFLTTNYLAISKVYTS